jgi:hypothetical protein
LNELLNVFFLRILLALLRPRSKVTLNEIDLARTPPYVLLLVEDRPIKQQATVSSERGVSFRRVERKGAQQLPVLAVGERVVRRYARHEIVHGREEAC